MPDSNTLSMDLFQYAITMDSSFNIPVVAIWFKDFATGLAKD